MLKLTVEDIMDEHPLRVKEDVDVGSVSHLLFRYRINGVLVVRKRDKNKLLGIFTTTDMLRLIDAALSKGGHRIDSLTQLSRMPVGRVTNKTTIRLKKGDRVIKAIALMHKKSIDIIPVYDKTRLAGVIGRHDILDIALHQY